VCHTDWVRVCACFAGVTEAVAGTGCLTRCLHLLVDPCVVLLGHARPNHESSNTGAALEGIVIMIRLSVYQCVQEDRSISPGDESEPADRHEFEADFSIASRERLLTMNVDALVFPIYWPN
jgi:hypothetical protein